MHAESDGEPVTIRADRGVLLAAGGYERNGPLRREHQPEVGDEWAQGCEGNTGDALLAGVEVGAATDLLDESWFAPGLVVPGTRPVFCTSVWSGIGVLLDRRARHGGRAVGAGTRRPRVAVPPGVDASQASVEWPGNSDSAGSMTTAALLTAVATSPKPTEMSRILPGYAVTSPAA